jgi:hypothetical protein
VKRSIIALVLVAGCLLLVNSGSRELSAQTEPSVTGAPQGLPGLRANTDFGKMPLYFIPNDGQTDKQVIYYVQGKDKTLYFTPEGVTFALTAAAQPGSERWVVKLDFVDANENVKPVGKAETGATISYFRGRPEDWRTGISTYSRIVYHTLWRGIDLVYYGTVNKLKYEFVVDPGADPSDIRLAYRGAESVEVDPDGRLKVTTPSGDFSDDVPVAYQERDGKRMEVKLAYKMEGPGPTSRHEAPGDSAAGACEYGFQVGDYDPTLPLVLDPAILVYCGYIGGNSNDSGAGIAVDSGGNCYVTGTTGSSEANFPVTVGPDLTFNGFSEIFVAKVNSSGTGLVYCGYIGGVMSDRGNAIAVDSSGNAYVTGETFSGEPSFPVLVGPDLTHNGGFSDAFVAKVNPTGSSLLYCGFIGGSKDDYGYGVAVDGSGNAYVTGKTSSTEATFPVAIGPDLTFNGTGTSDTFDAFVAKVSPSGSSLLYCGYIGGSANDYGHGIAVDSGENAYIAGMVWSSEATFPVTVGPDLTFNGSFDAFVAKVNSAGTGLVYCGYVGGLYGDYVWRGIAVDKAGNAYIAGDTSSPETSFPVRVGPDLTYNGGTEDAFIAKVNASGTGLDYCGYLGGSQRDVPYGIAVDSGGNAYVVGETESTEATFPVRVGPDLTYNGGTNDAFIAKVDASGSNLVYCGYIGGSAANDIAMAIAVDGSGNAYVTGTTSSTEASFPVTVGPDLTHNLAIDAFVAKVYYFEQPESKHAVGDFYGDSWDEVAMDFGASGAWMWDNSVWTQIATGNPENLVAANVDGNNDDEILLDLGAAGLWLWDGGALSQISGVNVDCLAVGDTDADGSDEVAADFGASGLWYRNGGSWTQLSGANLEYLAIANLDGTGGAEIIGDFGAIGLWVWSGGSWTQLSGVNADAFTSGNTDGAGSEDLIGDFGPTGLWLFSGGAWTQLSGVNADNTITADIDHSGDKEIIGDFAGTGLWLWDSGTWTQLSGVNADDMLAADVDGDGAEEVMGDYAALGLWLWNGGVWSQISGVNPEGFLAADVDGDGAMELIVDFGSLGVWKWDAGAWSQISANNPD